MNQRYEPLVQEDLNIGTAMTFVGAPGGGELRATQVGLHSVARGQRAYEAAWTPGAVAAGSYVTTTVPVPDAATGDVVLASHDKILTNALRIVGHIQADGVARVVVHNPTSAAITIAAGIVAVIVFPFIGNAVPEPVDPPVAAFEWSGPLTGNPVWDVQFTDTSTGTITSWSWDFGDGIGTSTEQNPIYTYATAGPWTVVLTVTGPGGSDDDTQQVDMNI